MKNLIAVLVFGGALRGSTVQAQVQNSPTRGA